MNQDHEMDHEIEDVLREVRDANQSMNRARSVLAQSTVVWDHENYPPLWRRLDAASLDLQAILSRLDLLIQERPKV